MELTYTPQGDYLLPNLTLSEAETTIGKYGMMRKTFLKTERKGMYAHLMLSEQLNQHLADIDRTAREQIERTIQELLASAPGSGQGERSAGLDGTHEQPEATSGGTDSHGTDLSIKWFDRETEDRSLPFFHDQAIINDMLRAAPLRESKDGDCSVFRCP